MLRGFRNTARLPLEPGATFTDPGFVSATASPGWAEQLAGDGGTVVEINIPAGTHGLAALSSFEQEIILPRNATFTVTNVENADGVRYATVDATFPDPPHTPGIMSIDERIDRVTSQEQTRADLERERGIAASALTPPDAKMLLFERLTWDDTIGQAAFPPNGFRLVPADTTHANWLTIPEVLEATNKGSLPTVDSFMARLAEHMSKPIDPNWEPGQWTWGPGQWHHAPTAEFANPWHDENGRFAPKGMGSTSPGGSVPLPSREELLNSFDPVPETAEVENTLLEHMGPDGRLTPERQAVHDKLIADALAGIPQGNPKKALIMGGGAASGKTTASNAGHVTRPEGAIVINPDDFKVKIPETEGPAADGRQGNGAADRLGAAWAAYAHEESSYLGKRLHAAAIEHGANILLDKTSSNGAKAVKEGTGGLKKEEVVRATRSRLRSSRPTSTLPCRTRCRVAPRSGVRSRGRCFARAMTAPTRRSCRSPRKLGCLPSW